MFVDPGRRPGCSSCAGLRPEPDAVSVTFDELPSPIPTPSLLPAVAAEVTRPSTLMLPVPLFSVVRPKMCTPAPAAPESGARPLMVKAPLAVFSELLKIWTASVMASGSWLVPTAKPPEAVPEPRPIGAGLLLQPEPVLVNVEL